MIRFSVMAVLVCALVAPTSQGIEAPPTEDYVSSLTQNVENLAGDVMTCSGTSGTTIYQVRDHVENEQISVTVLWSTLTGDIRVAVENRLLGTDHGTRIIANGRTTDLQYENTGACGVHMGATLGTFRVEVITSAITLTMSYRDTVTLSYTTTFHGDWTIGAGGSSVQVGASSSGTIAVGRDYQVTWSSVATSFRQDYDSGLIRVRVLHAEVSG